jgi:hypothetical protein
MTKPKDTAMALLEAFASNALHPELFFAFELALTTLKIS